MEIKEFWVEGRGDFPFDMLRYDSCWPARGQDAALLEHHVKERRAIRMMTMTHGSPTRARWRSFLWACKEVPA